MFLCLIINTYKKEMLNAFLIGIINICLTLLPASLLLVQLIQDALDYKITGHQWHTIDS
jgi:hypothetical protein